MRRIHLLFGLLLASAVAWAATVDETSSKYKPDYGTYGTVGGVVIQTSNDAYNSEPVNATHPLPVSVTTTTSPSTVDSSADQTLLTSTSYDIAASATRAELFLQADSANTGELAIRDQSATTSEGFRLNPGEHIIIKTSGALRIRNNTAGSQIVHIMEVGG